MDASDYTGDYQQEIAAMKAPLMEQWRQMEDAYELQTDDGNRKKMQLRWAKYVAELLDRDYPLETALLTEPIP